MTQMNRRNFIGALGAASIFAAIGTMADSQSDTEIDCKQNHVHNIMKCFGAKGDGIHDDTASFRRAMQFACVIPPGIYLTTCPLLPLTFMENWLWK